MTPRFKTSLVARTGAGPPLPVSLRACATRLIATRRPCFLAVIKIAFAPFVSREIGVSIYAGRILGPGGQEKLFKIKFGFR